MHCDYVRVIFTIKSIFCLNLERLSKSKNLKFVLKDKAGAFISEEKPKTAHYSIFSSSQYTYDDKYVCIFMSAYVAKAIV